MLLGQTGEQIKQAKILIKQSGMSEKQRDLAKKQGYSDKQINDAVEKLRWLVLCLRKKVF